MKVTDEATRWRSVSEELASHLHLLQQQLISSEQEGSSCLEAMNVLMDVLQDASLTPQMGSASNPTSDVLPAADVGKQVGGSWNTLEDCSCTRARMP